MEGGEGERERERRAKSLNLLGKYRSSYETCKLTKTYDKILEGGREREREFFVYADKTPFLYMISFTRVLDSGT